MPEQDVTDRLTSFYRSVDAAIPERAPAWLPDARRSAQSGWRMQLFATAAMLLIAVAIGLLIYLARLQQVTPAHHRPGAAEIALRDARPMAVQDGQRGWIFTGNQLLQTSDGGRQWRDASAPATQNPWCCAYYFLDAQHGWACCDSSSDSLSSSGSRMGTFFRTTDGGSSWQRVGAVGPTVSSWPCCGNVDFVDPLHGWLAYADDSPTTTWGVGRLYRTADGGVTWSSMPDLPGAPAAHGGLAEPAIVSLRFVSLSRGWYVGYNSAGNEALYASRDGGSSWTEQALPIPAWEQPAGRHLTLPGFLKNGDGVLPITLDDGSVLLEFSNDSGASWHLDTVRAPLLHRPATPETVGLYQVVPTFVGNGVIAVVLGNQIELNTGTGWKSIDARGLPGVIVDIQFANARQGWALSAQGLSIGASTVGSSVCNGPSCTSNNVVLMKTTDGGATWTRLDG